MAPYLYKPGIYNIEEVHKLYKKLESEKTSVEFTSQDEKFIPMLEEWMKKLTIKRFKTIITIWRK